MPRPTYRRATVLAAAVLVVGTVIPAAPASAVSTSVVISEVYGGGGNSGATYTNDFVEVQALGATALDGYSVQYLPGAPTGSSTWQSTPLSGSVAAGGYHLVQEAQGAGGTTALPTPDDIGSIALSSSGGTVALVHDTATLTCRTVADCSADTRIVDLVGYGAGATTVHETGGGSAPVPSNTTSVQRAAAGTDTDDNAADFTTAAPTPKAAPAGGITTPCTPDPASATVDQIQGNAFLSAYAGRPVTGVRGIDFAKGAAGFWFQQVDGVDADPATSEGLYVYTGSAPAVAVGDSVAVTGRVSEYDPQATHSATTNLTITELGSVTTLCVVSSAQALPPPVVLGLDTPGDYAFDHGGASIEALSVDPARSALDYYESLEGMRVEVDDAQVVGPSNQYGEQYVTTEPGQARTYRGGAELLGENRTPSGRLEVVPLDGSDPAVDVGDEFADATVGALDYSNFGGYVLRADVLGAVVHRQLPRVTAHPGTPDQLSIATYNVENLSPADPGAKFSALAAGIVHNLAGPDVVALEEIQDDTGPADDGVVDARRTLKKLISRIVVAGGPRYKYREIDPVDDQDGGQPGGNIRVAFLYDPTRVDFVGSGPQHVDRSTTGTQVTDHDGTPGLTLSPGRIDPTDAAWSSSRKPLVGQFRFHGKDVFVIANHFDSKGGDQSADGRFQYPEQSSAVQRAQQATLVHDFVGRLLGVDTQARVVVVGDLNDYQFSPALATLRTGTADGSGPSIMTDLITTRPVNEQYTYVYNGVSQVLDHILATAAVTSGAFDYQVVHVNSEYHDQVSDHDPQVVDISP